MDMDITVTPCEKGKGRKKARQRENWKRVAKQALRHKPKELPLKPNCKHSKRVFSCEEITSAETLKFHNNLYSMNDKIKQDMFLLKFCNGTNPKKALRRSHRISIKYYVPSDGGHLKRVCKRAFLNITKVSADRIERVVANFVRSGEMPKERRGGDKIKDKNNESKLIIKQFVESLTCIESHYSRERTSRLFLQCDLNFKKLYDMYRKKTNNPVKLSYFRNYLNANYNISFGTPLTDVCSTCIRTKELLKKENSDPAKVDIMTEQRVHTLRAKAFYSMLKSSLENVEKLSFDCQKNLVLPKLPDQCAYFSQQINFYNFTIVNGNSLTKLCPQTVSSYVWLESQYSKNSNAIASAVYNTLIGHTFNEKINKIHLFADGAGGQNKNSTMMAMLATYLANDAPKQIKTIEITFPIVGHSFLPSDRVFGLVERKIKKQDIIINRSHYENIIGEFSTVRRLDEDWCIFDWKKLSADFYKKPAQYHFKFNECKRFIFNRDGPVTIRGEVLYKSDLSFNKSILKKGRSLTGLKPNRIITGNQLKGDKSSIINLLKQHYGADWRQNPELEFYKILDNNRINHSEEDNCSDTEVLEEVPEMSLRV